MKFKIMESYLYHVTHTKNIPKIKKEGICPFKTSNWVKGTGERYGNGEIYAFNNATDALRWAARMDWDFHKNMGSGKIAIIRFKEEGKWKIDENDPLSQLGKFGDWLKKEGMVQPEKIDKSIVVTPKMVKGLVSSQDQDLGDIFNEI